MENRRKWTMQLLTAIVLWVTMLAGSSAPTLAQTQPDEDCLFITQWDLSKPAVEVSVGGSKATADS
jgi:hypothetical protein